MSASRRTFVLFTVAVAALILAALALRPSNGTFRSDDVLLGRSGAGQADNPEAEEQAEGAHQRAEAFERAVEAGTAGKAFTLAAAPAPGWAGEHLVDAAADD